MRKIKEFMEKHKNAILLACSYLAVTGLSYYAGYRASEVGFEKSLDKAFEAGIDFVYETPKHHYCIKK